MRDSLTSGQPLILVYSYSKRGVPAGSDWLRVSLATHATGRVRLQVTGNPPTVSALVFPRPQPETASGSVRVARLCSSALREKVSRFTESSSDPPKAPPSALPSRFWPDAS